MITAYLYWPTVPGRQETSLTRKQRNAGFNGNCGSGRRNSENKKNHIIPATEKMIVSDEPYRIILQSIRRSHRRWEW